MPRGGRLKTLRVVACVSAFVVGAHILCESRNWGSADFPLSAFEADEYALKDSDEFCLLVTAVLGASVVEVVMMSD